MATLVLNAVGTAVGGPVGGAIGALIGRSVDGALLAPKRREGPRLTELAVQTSSYGSQIPKLFGTMRVAGTVIWATDLIETRTKSGGGKGQPGVATYSYAASFAVLLSARAIRGVGRIWAEGKLLRGSAGDFKTATGFRLRLGGEDQPVDPLIASAEGVGLTPAHRGCAYAVFEQMQLADYGNRIPSLTFEVIADEGEVAVSDIAHALAGEVSGTTTLRLGGFAAAGGSVGAVLATLGRAGGAWFASEGAGLMMRDAAVDPVAIVDAGVAASARGGAVGARSVAAIDTVPVTIGVGHYDPARDYQAGLQRARRPGAGSRDERVEVPAVMEAGLAKTVAAGMLARAESGRVRRRVTTAFGGLALAPGQCVTIRDEAGRDEAGLWRITDMLVEDMATKLTLTPVERAPVAVGASGGRVLGAADAPVGATILAVVELPGLDDAPLSAPRIGIAATGAGVGWRQAALLYSIDDGANWVAAGATASPAVLGSVAVVAGAAPAAVVDRAGAFEVVLSRGDMDLHDADAVALDGGANLAAIGGELIQFGRAEPLGGGRWRLTELWRGRRGTEAAIGTQQPGDAFAVLDAVSVRAIDLPLSAVGRAVRVMASGVGDATPVEATRTVRGLGVVPPAPVHLRWTGDAGGGGVVRWVRRSRAGWRWIDGVDAPIGEEREAYRVTIAGAGTGGGGRETETTEPFVAIDSADLAQGPVAVTVRQRGTFGESDPARIMVPGWETSE